MTLGERLSIYVSERGQKQEAIAAEWLELYAQKNPKEPEKKPSTVTSHLSRCLNDQPEGVRFFFAKDALRADLLFEILRVPSAEQAELRRLARECLDKEGAVTCRLVIDATTWGATREQAEPLFDALKQIVLHPAEKIKLVPVALVLTEEQLDFLPRSYDRLGDWFRREEVKDSQEGWSKVAKLAGDGALVASSRLFQPMERWLAMEDGGKSLSLEPADGIATFLTNSRLPAPPAHVPHDLAQIATVDGKSKAPIPSTPTQRRRMMLALADEGQSAALKLSSSARLALSQALGVKATSTERERLEHELAGLASRIGAEPKNVTQAELDQLLARAKRRQVEFSLLRVGDELHALNPPQKVTLPQSPRLKVHQRKSQSPAINRLMAVIDKWTADDYAADRGLVRVIERLDPTGEERLAFLHARACLLWTNGLCVPATPSQLPDWKEGLSRLLAGEPPAAQLRLFVDANARVLSKELGHHMKPCLVFRQELTETWPNFMPTAARSIEDPTVTLLQWALSKEPMVLGRQQAVCLLDSYDRQEVNNDSWGYQQTKIYPAASYYSLEEVRSNYGQYGLSRQQAQHSELLKKLPGLPSVLIPTSWKLLREGDLWLDLFDCSKALGGTSPDPASWARVGTEIDNDKLVPIRKVTLYEEAVEFPKNIWSDADQDLALCWLALKNALAQGNAVRLHDGIVLLSMGAGLFARINIRACATVDASSADERQVRGCLDAWVRHGTRKSKDTEQGFWGVRLDRHSVITHRASTTGYGDITATTTLGYELPELYLAGHGLRAEITFLTSPLFLSYGGMSPSVAALAAAGTQALAEAQSDDQRQADEAAYDDDDDD